MHSVISESQVMFKGQGKLYITCYKNVKWHLKKELKQKKGSEWNCLDKGVCIPRCMYTWVHDGMGVCTRGCMTAWVYDGMGV